MNILQHKQDISEDRAQALKAGFTKTYQDQGYDVLLTLTFTNGRTISTDLADYLIDIYLRQLDRLYFGKIKGKQRTRIERDVFRETKDKEKKRFIHYHILMKSIGNQELFTENLKALFGKYISKAQEADTQFYTRAGHYGVKHDWRHGDVGINNWLQLKSHTDQNTEHYIMARRYGESEAALKRIHRLHFEQRTNTQTKAFIRQHFWQ